MAGLVVVAWHDHHRPTMRGSIIHYNNHSTFLALARSLALSRFPALQLSSSLALLLSRSLNCLLFRSAPYLFCQGLSSDSEPILKVRARLQELHAL